MPTEIAELLGPPALLPGECDVTYQKLAAQLIASLEPADSVEWLWFRDVSDLTWEILRYRRLENSYLTDCMPDALEKLLASLLAAEGLWGEYAPEVQARTQKLSKGWRQGDKDACYEVERLLKENGLSLESLVAQTLVSKMRDIEKIRRLRAAAEERRDKVYREWERRRTVIAERVAAIEADWAPVTEAVSRSAGPSEP